VPDAVDIAGVVETALSQFLAESSPDPLGLRKLAAELHALPLYYGWFRCLAIRPDGEIVSFDIDAPDGIQPSGRIRIEKGSIIRNLALHQGSKKYAELQILVPGRTPDAIECPYCGGKREFPEPNTKVICFCGGLGWLPSSVQQPDDDSFDR
jgi:hypothetical protein